MLCAHASRVTRAPEPQEWCKQEESREEEEVGSWARKGFVSLGFALHQQPTERRNRKGPQKVHKTERRRAVETEVELTMEGRTKRDKAEARKGKTEEQQRAGARAYQKRLTKEPRWERFRFIGQRGMQVGVHQRGDTVLRRAAIDRGVF
ncbi:hypothetical protein ERJ75_000618800 [Trypanosoma vivax]|nr:hypothetical protein ERJ75_000618800 [Trypanosoma vivax]